MGAMKFALAAAMLATVLCRHSEAYGATVHATAFVENPLGSLVGGDTHRIIEAENEAATSLGYTVSTPWGGRAADARAYAGPRSSGIDNLVTLKVFASYFSDAEPATYSIETRADAAWRDTLIVESISGDPISSDLRLALHYSVSGSIIVPSESESLYGAGGIFTLNFVTGTGSTAFGIRVTSNSGDVSVDTDGGWAYANGAFAGFGFATFGINIDDADSARALLPFQISTNARAYASRGAGSIVDSMSTGYLIGVTLEDGRPLSAAGLTYRLESQLADGAIVPEPTSMAMAGL